MSRLVRWLVGRNTLRRPVDRIEGAVLVALAAAFLVAMAVASILGVHTYQSQRAASAGLRPVVAVLSQAGPSPGGQVAMIVNALAPSTTVAGGAGITLLVCYGLCRLVLDRRRLAAWESAWSLTGPRWTTRH
jgi:amino acid transporter